MTLFIKSQGRIKGPRSGRRRVAQGTAGALTPATPWVSESATSLLVLAWEVRLRQHEEKSSVNTDCRPRAFQAIFMGDSSEYKTLRLSPFEFLENTRLERK